MSPTSLPRRLVWGLPVLASLTLLAVVALACSGDSDGSMATSPTATPVPAGLDIAPTETPATQAQVVVEPTPTPEPQPEPAPEPSPTEPPAEENRADCAAIRGTAYRSETEREWYGANCGLIARAPASNGSSSSPAPQASAPSPPGSQVPMGDRLIIPSVGVNTEVYRTAVPASGVMPDPSGYFNALWYDFASLPGLGGNFDSGNIVLSGHVDCGKCVNGGPGTAVFWSVRNLKPGDTAQYRTADGRTQDYVVTSSHSLGGGVDGASLVSAGAADMTLITCTGTFSGGEYSLRHIVTLSKA